MLCRNFPIDTEGIIENRDTTISLRMIEVATFSSNSRSLKLSNLVSGIAYGALLPAFRKHLINNGAEADFIKIFVLNSHKDKGGKKTASRTTRLPRLLIMTRLSKVRRICCYKTIFSYISFTFCHGFAVVPCNSGRNL